MTKKYDYNTAVLWNRDDMAAASGPYNASLREGAKELGAEWTRPRDGGETGAWTLPLERADELRGLLVECYGEYVDEFADETPEEAQQEAAPVATKLMQLRVTDNFDGRKRGTERLAVAGVDVARIWRGKARGNEQHDPAKVYLADGVELVSGGFEMDDAGRMQPVGETVLSVELPEGAENTVEFEVVAEDATQEERFSEAVEAAAKKVEGDDAKAYAEARKLASGERQVDVNEWDKQFGATPKRMRRGWVYAYLHARNEDPDCPAALREVRNAVKRRVEGGEPEVMAEWLHSAHERLAIRAAISAQ